MADITFEVIRLEEPDNPSPYISLADPTIDIANLKDAEEVVINESSIRVIADYPLEDEFEFEVKPFDDAQHFTRASLAHAISALYQRIYTEEDRTSPEVAGHVPGMLNRDTTEGQYGIWGHDLSDLALHAVSREEDGRYSLGIDS